MVPVPTEYWYRCVPSYDASWIVYNKFEVYEHTPKGVWVGRFGRIFHEPGEPVDKQLELRWVSKNAVSRFAYPTREEALNSLYHRNRHYIKILEARLASAKETREVVARVKDGDKSVVAPKLRWNGYADL